MFKQSVLHTSDGSHATTARSGKAMPQVPPHRLSPAIPAGPAAFCHGDEVLCDEVPRGAPVAFCDSSAAVLPQFCRSFATGGVLSRLGLYSFEPASSSLIPRCAIRPAAC
jgi:hypothetical protein